MKELKAIVAALLAQKDVKPNQMATAFYNALIKSSR